MNFSHCQLKYISLHCYFQNIILIIFLILHIDNLLKAGGTATRTVLQPSTLQAAFQVPVVFLKIPYSYCILKKIAYFEKYFVKLMLLSFTFKIYGKYSCFCKQHYPSMPERKSRTVEFLTLHVINRQTGRVSY